MKQSQKNKIVEWCILLFIAVVFLASSYGYTTNIIELITDDTMKVPEFAVRFLGVFCMPLGAFAGYY